MNNITITTPENIEIRHRLAGVGSRLVAASVDAIIQGGALFLIMYISMIIFLPDNFSGEMSGNFAYYILSILIISYFLLFYMYHIFFEHIMKGQTPGKKILGLRVIKENGQPIGLTQSIIRNTIKFFLDYFGIGLIFVIFNKKHKRLGDIAASTIVVSENPGMIDIKTLTIDDLTDLTVVSTLNNTLVLDDEEYSLLKDFFSRREQFIEGSEDRLLAQVKLFLTLKFKIPMDLLNIDVIKRIVELNKR